MAGEKTHGTTVILEANVVIREYDSKCVAHNFISATFNRLDYWAHLLLAACFVPKAIYPLSSDYHQRNAVVCSLGS